MVHCASGKYFKWAAHDDVIGPDFLSECLRGFEENGEQTVLVYPNFEFTDAQLNPVDLQSPSVHTTEATPLARLRAAIADLGLVTSVFGVYRRDALMKTRLIGSHIGSNLDLLVETALLGKIVKLDGDVLFSRRLHDGISTRANPTRSELLTWFDPDASDSKGLFSTRYGRFLVSINSIPGLTPSQRIGGNLLIAWKAFQMFARAASRRASDLLVPMRIRSRGDEPDREASKKSSEYRSTTTLAAPAVRD